MNGLKFASGILIALCVAATQVAEVRAQRIYTGSAVVGESQYSGGTSLDANGRAVNADGRALDRYGLAVGDYGAAPAAYPPHAAAIAAYPGGYYYPGGYSGLEYVPGMGYSVGVSGYSGGYSATAGRFGPAGFGVGTTYIAPPRTIVVPGVYPSRTVMNNATRGGVLEYTHNGNGYVYEPGRSAQTVISSGPSIFPTISVVQPSQPPVVIDSRPTRTARVFTGSTPDVSPRNPVGQRGKITLTYPADSDNPFSYVLNGTVYTIKPGYSQTFADDRLWTIEFPQGGNGSPIMKYRLKEGVYQFVADENGWDLRGVPVVSTSPSTPTLLPPSALPPSPSPAQPPQEVAAPVPSPDL